MDSDRTLGDSDELARRHPRAPGHAAENAALVALAQAQAASRADLLQAVEVNCRFLIEEFGRARSDGTFPVPEAGRIETDMFEETIGSTRWQMHLPLNCESLYVRANKAFAWISSNTRVRNSKATHLERAARVDPHKPRTVSHAARSCHSKSRLESNRRCLRLNRRGCPT